MADDAPFPFDTLEATFTALTRGPAPLSLDGRQVGHGLPARLLVLDELRRLLLDPSMGFAARDAALATLVDHAKTDGSQATIALAGVLLPGLRRATAPLTLANPRRIWDLQAEALAGLLEAIATFPTPARQVDRVAARLVWAAIHAAERLLARERVWHAHTTGVPRSSAPPPRPAGHPDFVLARAVRDGVLSREDAELVGETRIGRVRLCDLARAQGAPYKTLAKRRDRAERALVRWLIRDHPGTIASAATYRRGRSRGTLPRPGSATTPQPPDGS
jgi:hypothetical protein